MESLTEPLISGANDHAHIASDCDDDHHENSTLTAQRDEENNNDYVQLIDDHDDDANADSTYPLDPRRFAILTIFCLNNLIGSAAWITFAPIEDAVKAKFEGYGSTISSQQINWLSMISMVVYGPGTALCAWVVPKYGFRETVIGSSVIMALGFYLRWLSFNVLIPHDGAMSDEYSSSTTRYSILLTGQGLVALGQTIFMNAPARVAASWFQQTTKPIGAINLCSNFGIIVGQALSPLCVVPETGEYLNQLLGAQGIVMAICSLFTGYSFQYEEPAYPPSASEAARRRERLRQSDNSSDPTASPSALKDVKKLVTNPQYVILTIAFGITYGLNGTIMTLMEPWLALCGFSGDETAGLFGSLLVGGGLVGTWIASTLLDITRNYNQAIRWSFVSIAAVAVGLVATLYPKCPTWVLATAFTLTGMTQGPLTAICTDAVAAHTYPVSEELSSAGLQMVGQYLAVVMVNGMSYLIESESGGESYGFSAKVNIAYIGLLAVSSFFACCYNSEDLRANTANNEESLQNSTDQTMPLLGNTNSSDDDIGTETSDIDRI